MSVRDKRPAFTWVTNASLALIRRGVPKAQQPSVRNALLALAEAASRRKDGQHREGDTLDEVATFAGVSARRLRPHLRELERLGLVQITENTHPRGGDAPTIYTLAPERSDDSSDRAGSRSDDSSRGSGSLAPQRPTSRARPERVELQEEEPPQPPGSGGSTVFPAKPDGYRDHGRKRKEDTAHDNDVAAIVAEHFPGIPVRLVSHYAVELRSVGTEPTVDAMRPLVDRHRPLEAAA